MKLFCKTDDNNYRFKLEISQTPTKDFLYSYCEYKVEPKNSDELDLQVRTLLFEEDSEMTIIESEQEIGDYDNILTLYNLKYNELLKLTGIYENLETGDRTSSKLIVIEDEDNYLRAVSEPVMSYTISSSAFDLCANTAYVGNTTSAYTVCLSGMGYFSPEKGINPLPF